MVFKMYIILKLTLYITFVYANSLNNKINDILRRNVIILNCEYPNTNQLIWSNGVGLVVMIKGRLEKLLYVVFNV